MVLLNGFAIFYMKIMKLFNGNRLKSARQYRGLTVEELAQKIGVQRSQVSKIESGRNLTLSTIARVFKAMGMKASLSISGLGSITL